MKPLAPVLVNVPLVPTIALRYTGSAHLKIFLAFPNHFIRRLSPSVGSLHHCGRGGVFVYAIKVMKT